MKPPIETLFDALNNGIVALIEVITASRRALTNQAGWQDDEEIFNLVELIDTRMGWRKGAPDEAKGAYDQ